MQTLNIIGCGNVGRTLGRLWSESGVFRIRHVLNHTLAGGEAAVRFVGAGRAIERVADLGPADAVMMSTPDDLIEECAKRLAESGTIAEGTVVFHCSGALPSAILEQVSGGKWHCASMHPVKSFAEPSLAVESFAGTYCGIEGHPSARTMLQHACRAIGATPLAIDPRFKTVYHAGSVIACNYLTSLLEVAIRCFEKSGIPAETTVRMIGPLAHGTVDNVARLGTARALTGPIARGERAVVAAQCDALGEWDPEIAALYKALGRIAADLSQRQGAADPVDLQAIRELLE